MVPQGQDIDLKRRLSRWQIFFIAIGGIIGVGFFTGSSATLALSGPIGSLIAVLLMGFVAIAVMEGICHMIVLWPIPNAMVKYVNAFLDEDLGVAVGIMYWYLYCVTFSVLVIKAVDLSEYWGGTNHVVKGFIYVLVPAALVVINALPVQIFGWIELIGGVAKLALVVGTIILMFMINAGVGPGESIGSKYLAVGVAHNPNAVKYDFEAVFAAIPLATFAYIGVELLTTTAFEARDPHELKLPASNVGIFSFLLYGVATGAFVINVYWQDQQLPKLFNQAVAMITTPLPNGVTEEYLAPFEPSWPPTHAVPLIALYRAGWGEGSLRVLPSFLNGCFIYSALSCANTGLYVASRQLYGLTRSIEVTNDSSIWRKFFAWMSGVHHGTKAPWPAVFISAAVLCWLPFIRLGKDTQYLQDVQAALINIGSVSAILMWSSQCFAYIMFFHWRQKHTAELEQRRTRWGKLFNQKYTGYFQIFQPGLAYVGAISTLALVFFFNTVSLWNGKNISLKAISTFVSPAIVLLIWLGKKAFWPHNGRRRFFVRLSEWDDFERRLLDLDGLIFPIMPNAPAAPANEMQEHMLGEFDRENGANAFPGGADASNPSLDSPPRPLFDRSRIPLETRLGPTPNAFGGFGPALPNPSGEALPVADEGVNGPPAQQGAVPGGWQNSALPPQAHLAPPGTLRPHHSNELFEADTNVSLGSSSNSHGPLRPGQNPQERNTVPPGAQRYPYEQGHGYGYGF